MCPAVVWINKRGGVTIGEGIVMSGLSPCFSTGVWGRIGSGCFGCVHGGWTCL